MNFSTKISNTAFPLSCCLESLIIYKKPILISFVEKYCQDLNLKMIILHKLEVPNILRIVVTYLSIKLQSIMLEFGSQNNFFKTGTKWLCTIYSIIKTLSSKNAERGYRNLIHKQSIWVTFCHWNGTFLGEKWKKTKYSQWW